MSGLSFDMNWFAADRGADEIRHTSGSLQIRVDDAVVTRVYDDAARSVRDAVFVSAYPLALWLAGAWWRLLWETTPGEPTTDWRMTHEIAAAGYGYVWPRLSFVSDGETVEAICIPCSNASTDPLRYLTRARARLPLAVCERALADFVELVVRRLDTVGISASHLQQLWNEVQHERNDPVVAEMRRLEARLRADPTEAPPSVFASLHALRIEAGSAAVNEIAPLCAGPKGADELARIVHIARGEGARAAFSELDAVREACRHTVQMTPWDRGRMVARTLRSACHLDGEPLTNEHLASLLGSDASLLQSSTGIAVPLSLAVRGPQPGAAKVVLRRRHRTSRRFDAARLLIDHFAADAPNEHWLLATDSRTARQRMQRAFAAELLAPIDAVERELAGDFSDDALEDVARRFDVSPLLVRAHLANHGLIPPSAVELTGRYA